MGLLANPIFKLLRIAEEIYNKKIFGKINFFCMFITNPNLS